jgi:transcriptional regulator with PAS, ATPase and Fis domain
MREKPGKFELAGCGTILLDEIAEMSPHLQAKLLHILQDGEFNRLGGVRPLRVSARVLASTNKRLEQAVEKGDFREDLFYRLNVIKIEIPPLRERREDIPSLAQNFLNRYRAKYHRGALQLPEPLAAAFLRYSWPGNVRQLENVIRRYVIVPDVELALSELQDRVEPPALERKRAASLKEVAATASEEAEKQLVIRTLQEVNWNRKEAARRLNICYKSLLNRLHRWQVDGRSPRRATADPEPLADGTSGAAPRTKP